MLPLDILIPAIVSLIIGLGAHFVSLNINRSKNNAMKDIRGYSALETQLGNAIEENKSLEAKLADREVQANELRDLKYSLELKIALLEREVNTLKETLKSLREEKFHLKAEISMLKQQEEQS